MKIDPLPADTARGISLTGRPSADRKRSRPSLFRAWLAQVEGLVAPLMSNASAKQEDALIIARAHMQRADRLLLTGQPECGSEDVYLAMREYRSAVIAFARLGADDEADKARWKLARTLYEIGWNDAQQKALLEAVSLFKGLIETGASDRIDVSVLSLYWRIGDCECELGHLLGQPGRFENAVTAYGNALRAIENDQNNDAWLGIQGSLALCWEELSAHAAGDGAAWNALEIYEQLSSAYTRRCKFALARVMRDKARELRDGLQPLR